MTAAFRCLPSLLARGWHARTNLPCGAMGERCGRPAGRDHGHVADAAVPGERGGRASAMRPSGGWRWTRHDAPAGTARPARARPWVNFVRRASPAGASYTPRMVQAPVVPSYVELLWPTLRAIRAIGDSGSIEEIVEKVIELEGFTEEQQSVLHVDGPGSEIQYRLAWTRTYLKGMGLLDNSARGVWALTDKGRDPTLDEATVLKLHAEYTAQLRARQRARRKAERAREPATVDGAGQEPARDWKEELLDALGPCRRLGSSGLLSGCCGRPGSSVRP